MIKELQLNTVSGWMNLFGKIVIVAAGLFLVALGVIFFLKAGLGVDSFTIFYEGVALTLSISTGRALQLSLIVLVIIIFFIDRSRLGIGTLMHAFLTGIYIDLLLSVNVPGPSGLLGSSLLLVLAVITVGSGLALYIFGGLGVGAVDALMLILHKKTGKDIKWVRIGLDSSLVLLGYLLGGPFGIGTFIAMLLTGPVIEAVLKLLNICFKRFPESH